MTARSQTITRLRRVGGAVLAVAASLAAGSAFGQSQSFARMQNYSSLIDSYIGSRTFDRKAWRDEREMGDADLGAFAEAARIYSGTIGPQFRSYLQSLERLDRTFVESLASARDTLAVVSRGPDTPQKRKAMRGQLDAIAKILSLPAQTANLAERAETYGQLLTRHMGQQQQLARIRDEQVRRKIDLDERNSDQDRRRGRIDRDRRHDEELNPSHDTLIPGTNYPGDSADIMRRAYPGSPRDSDLPPNQYPSVPRIPDPLPQRAVIEQEQFAYEDLANASRLALAVLPALKTCISQTKNPEGQVREALARAIAAEGRYDVIKRSLDDLDSRWRELMAAVRGCSAPNMWGN
jgi:hypothetical protein